jgi:recombination protein RecA
MSQAMRKLTPIAGSTGCIVVFINQIRQKIGVMFGNPETTTGGNALKFYASVRLDVRRVSTIKVGDEAVGNHVKVKVVKNKVAPPFREAEFDIMFGKGISASGDVIDIAANNDIIQKSGSWFSYNGEKIGQGRENAKLYLEEHPDVMDEVIVKVKEKYGVGVPKDAKQAAAVDAKQGATEGAAQDDAPKDVKGRTKAAKE